MLRLLAVFVALSASGALAQEGDTLVVDLPDVRVEAARGAGGVATAAFGVAVEERGAMARTTEAGAGIDVALRTLPGVFVANRENPALGERAVVRGLGYRSGFGVRGVQVVLDGIPLTLADGQAVLGIVDPAFVRRAELVRGPASALWGNGSGGVLFLQTIPAEASVATVRGLGGSDGFARVDGEAASTLGPHRAGLAVSHARGDGHRTYSGFEQTRARAFGDLHLGPAASLRLVAALEAAPRLEHPGALTAEELAADRRQAETRYVDAAAGKSSTQGQLAATLQTEVRGGAFTATAYGVARGLENPLPFAVITVDRLAGGTRVAFEREGHDEVVASLAIQTIGGATVGVYTTSSAEQLAYHLQHSGSVGLILEDAEQLEKWLAIAPQCANVRWVIVICRRCAGAAARSSDRHGSVDDRERQAGMWTLRRRARTQRSRGTP